MKKIALLALVPCALLTAESPFADIKELLETPISRETVSILARAAEKTTKKMGRDTGKKIVQEKAKEWASKLESEVTGDKELVNLLGMKVSTADIARFLAVVGVDCAYDRLDGLSKGEGFIKEGDSAREAVKSSLHNALLHTESRAASVALKTASKIAWSGLNPFDLSFLNLDLEDYLGQPAGVVANYACNAYADEFLNNVVKYLIANNASWHKSDGAVHAAE